MSKTAKKQTKEKTEPVQVRFPVSIKRDLKIEAAVNDTTMSQILLEAYALYKKQNDKK